VFRGCSTSVVAWFTDSNRLSTLTGPDRESLLGASLHLLESSRLKHTVFLGLTVGLDDQTLRRIFARRRVFARNALRRSTGMRFTYKRPRVPHEFLYHPPQPHTKWNPISGSGRSITRLTSMVLVCEFTSRNIRITLTRLRSASHVQKPQR